jgi:para-nitrobenzyl esterase
MKTSTLLLLGTLTLTCSCSSFHQSSQVENPVLSIEGGRVTGTFNADSTILIYKGVPYAAAPVGDLRWRKPQPVTPWDTILVADHFRNAAPQLAHDPNDGQYGTEFFAVDAPFSEDCLHVNIWTPKEAANHPEKKLPVALWIHGGAYNSGWGFEPEMDGEAFACKGVILVTINYRLGVFGFLTHPLLSAEDGGHSGNYGTYDQIAAIEWVCRNISKFGGDGENLTVFGQSAGAASVKNMVTSPLSRNMVKKAIIQSGGGMTGIPVPETSQEELDAHMKEVYDAAGLTTLEQLRAATFEELMACAPQWPSPGALMFGPHLDNVVLTEDFSESAKNGNLADIPYMLGHCGDDMPMLSYGEQLFAETRESLSQQPTYIYFFNRPLPTDGRPSLQGSFHSSELWYVFNTLGRCWRPFTEGDYQLSEEMVTAWTNFVKYGNPNGETGDSWKPSTKANPFVYEFKVTE